MALIFAITRRVVLTVGLWGGLISAGQLIETNLDLPETTYLLVATFALYWTGRAIALCMAGPSPGGIALALGQLTALTLFVEWPVVRFDGGVSLQLVGPVFAPLPNTVPSAWLIGMSTAAQFLLPAILIAAAAVLAAGSIFRHVQIGNQTGHAATEPAASARRDAPLTPRQPDRSGYTTTNENPLDAFR